MIFEKAVNEPHFCPLYSDLCKKQVTMLGFTQYNNRSVKVDAERQAKAKRDKAPADEQPQSQSQQKEKSFKYDNKKNIAN
jgi:hypothetical protein